MKNWLVLCSFVMVHIDIEMEFATIGSVISMYNKVEGKSETIRTKRRVTRKYAFEYCKKHGIKLEVKTVGINLDMLQGSKGLSN